MTDTGVKEYETEESIPIKSKQLVKDYLVMEALKNDKGQDAELLSWEIKPFTKKGDNFSSIVVSIEVRYRKNGTETEDTFVAKINPLRPMSPLTEAMEESYAREPIILSSIIGGMNKHLENLRLDNIRTPKLFSKNLEKGKEVIVTENLRTQGFKMHDRKIGLDFNHSILVVNEIGRLHASSVLYEEELYPKTLLETFPEFKRSFLDPNHHSFEMFRDFFRIDAENAKNFLLKAGPKYEKCVKWLSKHSQKMVDFYIDVFSSKKPFDVLVHADCYTNNLLFKYNEDNIPVDVRLVDLQLSVKATPVADLLYFLYSSISGDFRSQNMKTLITAYYESFCNVFRRAGKKPPFTYMELKQEFKNRQVFGLICGLLLLPILLADDEEILDMESFSSNEVEFAEKQSKKYEKLAQKGPFKERILALFDDMIENKVFDEIEDPIPEDSYALVTEELVKEALKNDKGSDVELLSWEIKPFTNLGDNYSSVVVAIEVNYQNNGTKLQDSFVAKLNPLRPDSAFTEAMEQLYTRETVILSSIIGEMNKQLKTLKLDKIKTPKLLSRSIEKGKEAFIAENLRTQGFRMYDRRIGLDLNHTLLVLNELGRFHASSILLEEEIYPKTLLETFKGFERTYLDRNHSSFEGYSKLFSAAADNAKNFLQNADPKYEECVKWLEKHRHEMIDIYLEAFFSSKKPFDVLTHCDCWTNNFLFRYNEDEIPVDIRFVDLQLAVKGSPAADLNYFFYTSINKDFRLKNLNTMLTTYYESFCNVLRRGGRQPPFTYPELKEEVKDKKLFGFVCGLLVLPIILGEGEEIFDVANFTADKIDEFNQQQSKKFEKLAQREGPFKDRYLVMFDEMIESNVFKEN